MGRSDDDGEGDRAHSCSSSIDSSNNPADHLHHHTFVSSVPSSSSSCCLGVSKRSSKDLSTDLKLGLSISPSHNNDVSSTSIQSTREPGFDWPPIKPLLRSTLAGHGGHVSLFVKVYMEGIPIGRKLDLFAHQGYNALITTLSHMFTTPILCPDDTADHHRVDHSEKHHVLTYEDKEGDWMMVGDVPWEMFLTTVKRLKITRADRC